MVSEMLRYRQASEELAQVPEVFEGTTELQSGRHGDEEMDNRLPRGLGRVWD